METASKTPASSIRDIVLQVKSGQIDKTDAFNGLKDILQRNSTQRKGSFNANNAASDISTASNTMTQDSVPKSSTFAEEDSGDVSFGSARFTREDRRDIINKLIEKKKAGRLSVRVGNEQEADDNLENYPASDNFSVSQQSRTLNETSEGSMAATGSTADYQTGNGGWSPGPTATAASSRDVSPSNLSRARKSTSPNFIRRSTTAGDDGPSQPGLRNQRILQAEAAIRQEMFKEHTFRPQIKPLPSSYGAAVDQEVPFYQRVTKWQKEKEQDAVQRKKSTDDSEVAGCTFKPRINKNSVKAVKVIRGDTKENANERLFKNADSDRAQRAKFLEEEIALEREKEAAELTFQPQLATKSSSRYAEAKAVYLTVGEQRPEPSHPPVTPKELKECTFKPKILGPSQHMNSAKLYLSTDVVDRLTRPVAQLNNNQTPSHQHSRGNITSDRFDPAMRSFDVSYFGDRPVMDVASFMSQMGGPNSNNNYNNNNNDAGFRTPRAAQGANSSVRLRPQSAPRERTPSVVSTAEMTEDQKIKFNSFMSRQEQSLVRKEQHVQDVARSTTPNFKPRLCRKSLDISERVSQGEFLYRVEKDVLRREDDSHKRKSQEESKTPFKPHINPKSEKLPSRSPHERSKGDLLRKQIREEETKKKVYKEMMDGATFHPAITPKAKELNKSALQLHENPGEFLGWVQKRQEKLNEQRKKYEEERTKKELEECTFVPKTKECPAYVKRIAKSMAIVNAARPQELIEPSKPQWL